MQTTLVNTFLHLDPESKARLKKLEGKTVNIEIRPFACKLHCHIHDGQMDVLTGHIESAETTIRGTPLQMVSMMLDKSNRQGLFKDDLSMEGSAEVGGEVMALFDALEIDWEEIVSHFTGDIPAHRLGNALRRLKSFVSETSTEFARNVGEFAQEEARWFPAREALQHLFDDIDDVKMGVDRAEARVAALKEGLSNENT